MRNGKLGGEGLLELCVICVDLNVIMNSGVDVSFNTIYLTDIFLFFLLAYEGSTPLFCLVSPDGRYMNVNILEVSHCRQLGNIN